MAEVDYVCNLTVGVDCPESSRYCPTLDLWSWNVACVRRVKLRLPYNPVAVEKSILQRINGIEACVTRT